MQYIGVYFPTLVIGLMVVGCMFHLIDEKNVDEK